MFDWKAELKNLESRKGLKIFDDLDELEKKAGLYCAELGKWNAKINLMASGEMERFWERHWFDSLKGALALQKGMFIDFGSGGGFPALPIVLSRADMRVVCVEKVLKKRTFLVSVGQILGLGSRLVVVESLSDAPVGNINQATVRAVRIEEAVKAFQKRLGAGNDRFSLFYWGQVAESGLTTTFDSDLNLTTVYL